jgi:hypothetical protein
MWALQAALARMAALLVACVASHTALLAPCPAPQINPHHPHTNMKSALILDQRFENKYIYVFQNMSLYRISLGNVGAGERIRRLLPGHECSRCTDRLERNYIGG